jgi:hypothetical protein
MLSQADQHAGTSHAAAVVHQLSETASLVMSASCRTQAPHFPGMVAPSFATGLSAALQAADNFAHIVDHDIDYSLTIRALQAWQH